MATAKEIESKLGISARTVETWSRKRDEKYLLALFLKSFSAIDIETRLEKIANDKNIKIVHTLELYQDLMTRPEIVIEESDEEPSCTISYLNGTPYLLLSNKENIYIIISSHSQIPPVKSIEKFYDFFSRHTVDKIGGRTINLVFLSPKKGADKLTRLESSNDTENCYVLDVDYVGSQLYCSDKLIILQESTLDKNAYHKSRLRHDSNAYLDGVFELPNNIFPESFKKNSDKIEK